MDATVADSSNDSSVDAAADVSDGGVVDGAMEAAASACDAGCRACCRDSHPDAGAIIRHDEMVCGCTQPGDCEAGATCGNNLCSTNQKETVACLACLDDPDAGDCTQKALAKCSVQPECAGLESCLASCGDGG